MSDTADRLARWLGLLSSGRLIGEEAEQSIEHARRVLGTERLVDLRRWFANADPIDVADAKRAAIEACLAIVHADRKVADEERELMDRIVELSELDEGSQAMLRHAFDEPPDLDAVAPRIRHLALRELVLALAWQLALADGRVVPEEYGEYGLLADRLAIPPPRASELRSLFSRAK